MTLREATWVASPSEPLPRGSKLIGMGRPRLRVIGRDPHGFDGEGDGRGLRGLSKSAIPFDAAAELGAPSFGGG